MNKVLSHQKLSVSVFKKDGWKLFPKSSLNDGSMHSFHLTVKEPTGEIFYELVHFTKNAWTVIYRTFDKEQPISERLILFRGTLTNVKDYETIMRVCEIKNCN